MVVKKFLLVDSTVGVDVMIQLMIRAVNLEQKVECIPCNYFPVSGYSNSTLKFKAATSYHIIPQLDQAFLPPYYKPITNY